MNYHPSNRPFHDFEKNLFHQNESQDLQDSNPLNQSLRLKPTESDSYSLDESNSVHFKNVVESPQVHRNQLLSAKTEMQGLVFRKKEQMIVNSSNQISQKELSQKNDNDEEGSEIEAFKADSSARNEIQMQFLKIIDDCFLSLKKSRDLFEDKNFFSTDLLEEFLEKSRARTNALRWIKKEE